MSIRVMCLMFMSAVRAIQGQVSLEVSTAAALRYPLIIEQWLPAEVLPTSE